jgi:hypothetical protein
MLGYMFNPVYFFEAISYQLVCESLRSALLTEFKIGLVMVQPILFGNLQNLLLQLRGDKGLSASFATRLFHGHKPLPSQVTE